MRSTRKTKSEIDINKITFLIIGAGLITIILIVKLFSLQILNHKYYQDIATREQYGYVELSAGRGEIIIKDYHSDEEFLIATNTTLNLLYADPALIKDPVYVGDILAPLLFNLDEERVADSERIEKLRKNIPNMIVEQELTEDEVKKLLAPLTDNELETNFKKDLIEKLGEKQRKRIQLTEEIDSSIQQTVTSLNLNGIEVLDNAVFAYPAQISNTKDTASKLAELVQIPSTKLTTILKGENRYVVLKRKLAPEISDQIIEISKNDETENFKGIDMTEEYFRYYPEKTLAANVIGYVDRNNEGQYGIESSFNMQLKGTPGKFQTKKDSIGRQITVGESIITPAIDGDDIVLTIDRSIQLKVDQILEQAVKSYRADSGQIIIMDPQTGKIIAMSHYPSFDSNNYGEVFKRKELELTPEEINSLYPTATEGLYYFYVNAITLDKYNVFEEKDENGNSHYYRYENFVGPEVYHNKIISWPYEPGSAFKTIVMAMGIDDGDITPNTTFNDSGPIGVDWNVYTEKYDFEIKNSHDYFGLIDMNTVLAESLNTGMTFVSKQIGPALFYSYLEKFGFLDKTDIEIDTENTGKIEYFEDWTESELATHAFGQGITITMLQLANAYSAIANGGTLMQPYIIDEIRHDNNTISKTEPKKIRQVISAETSAQMTAMLINAVENGVASPAKVENHFVAGKTGTSQTYKHGQALTGIGTTIATFAGFAPVNDPKFVIVIKFDRPKSTEWGAATAAPTFQKIGKYLFDYYNIPPDKTSN